MLSQAEPLPFLLFHHAHLPCFPCRDSRSRSDAGPPKVSALRSEHALAGGANCGISYITAGKWRPAGEEGQDWGRRGRRGKFCERSMQESLTIGCSDPDPNTQLVISHVCKPMQEVSHEQSKGTSLDGLTWRQRLRDVLMSRQCLRAGCVTPAYVTETAKVPLHSQDPLVEARRQATACSHFHGPCTSMAHTF